MYQRLYCVQFDPIQCNLFMPSHLLFSWKTSCSYVLWIKDDTNSKRWQRDFDLWDINLHLVNQRFQVWVDKAAKWVVNFTLGACTSINTSINNTMSRYVISSQNITYLVGISILSNICHCFCSIFQLFLFSSYCRIPYPRIYNTTLY